MPADLGRFYADGYFGCPDIAELRAVARGRERYRIELVERHLGAGRICEIGPGDGIFALQALEAGFDVSAVEMDADACARLRAQLDIDVVQSAAPEDVLAASAALDAVVGWHVIEHLPQPWALLEAAAAALRPGGVLVLATPNPEAFGLRLLGARWPHVDAPRHLFLIPHRTLVARGRELGLEPVGLTHADPGGLHWNAFAWHYLLRGPAIGPRADILLQRAGGALAAALAPVERRGMRGAAYTVVLRKR